MFGFRISYLSYYIPWGWVETMFIFDYKLDLGVYHLMQLCPCAWASEQNNIELFPRSTLSAALAYVSVSVRNWRDLSREYGGL
jgi:hypothetical protein